MQSVRGWRVRVVSARRGDAMLFFELFPAFMLIVVIVAAVGLFVADRQARRGDGD